MPRDHTINQCIIDPVDGHVLNSILVKRDGYLLDIDFYASGEMATATVQVFVDSAKKYEFGFFNNLWEKHRLLERIRLLRGDIITTKIACDDYRGTVHCCTVFISD